MTQTTLYSDKQLFVSLYKSALRRMRGMFLIYTLLSFITFPMPYIMHAVRAAARYSQGYSYYGYNGIPEIYPTISIFLYFTIVIAGAVLMSVFCNSFMHNRRAVDVFHALPVKRNVLLMANFCAVATILVTAQVLCYGVVAVTEAMVVHNALISSIIAEFFRVLLLTLVIAVITFFSSVCCNAGFDSAVFSTALMVIIPGYTLLFCLLMEMFVAGCNITSHIAVESVKFSPVIMMYETFMDGEVEQTLIVNLCYIAFAIFVMAYSCYLYRKRKSETAQSASTKSFLYQFVILAASVGGGVMFGILYNEIFGWGGDGVIELTVISCIFTTAIYLVVNGVMARNPKPTKRGLAGLGASLAIVIAMLICVDNGFFGYESYVPQTDNIQSVTINYAGDYTDVQMIYVNEKGNVHYTSGSAIGAKFTKSEEIEQVRKIHETLVNSIDKECDLFYRPVRITYSMKNGRTVERQYYGGIPVDIAGQMVALEDLDSFKTQLYPVLKTDYTQVKNFEIKDGFGQNLQRMSNLSEEQKQKLYEAMAQDTLNITRQMKDQRKGPVFARINVNYKDSAVAAEKEIAVQEAVTVIPERYANTAYKGIETSFNSNPIYENVVFDVTQDCINTFRVLEEIGYGQYTAIAMPDNMQAVVYACYSPLDYNSNKPYWQTNTIFDQSYVVDHIRWEPEDRIVEYTDAQQIAQLAENCQVSLYGPSQTKTFYAVMFIEKDVDWKEAEIGEYDCMVYYLSGNKAPDFIKTDLSEFYNEDNFYGYHGIMGN